MGIEERKPPNWGKDSLSKFIEEARRNTIGTFIYHKGAYGLLYDINSIFEKLINYLNNTPKYFPAFFVMRTHASYLGAVRLSISGQVCEAYMVLRGCLENALYGLYFFKNPESLEVWLNRHCNEDSMKLVRKEFTTRKLLDCLKSVNNDTYWAAQQIYDRTIDCGAHPNERALTQSLTQTKTEQEIEFYMSYLFEDSAPFRACLLTNAQVGVCSLDIFREVFRERFDILGISDDLGDLRERSVVLCSKGLID